MVYQDKEGPRQDYNCKTMKIRVLKVKKVDVVEVEKTIILYEN